MGIPCSYSIAAVVLPCNTALRNVLQLLKTKPLQYRANYVCSSVSLSVSVFPSHCVCVCVCARVVLFQLGGCVVNQLMVHG